MAHVTLFSTLAASAEGVADMDIEAATVKELMAALVARYPGLQVHFERGISLSIDGLVYRDPGYQPLRGDSEVVLLPKMTGG